MKKVKILVDREPLSKDYIQSKQNFGQVLSNVKNLKPPVWKSPWFYGPVGLTVVALSITAVNSLPPDNDVKKLNLEAVLPFKHRKIEAETLAFVSPKEESTSFREKGPEKILSEEIQQQTNALEEPKIDLKSVATEYETILDVANDRIEIIETPTKKALTKLPSINRVCTGEILIEDLCEKGIECLNAKITSFSLGYYNGVRDVVENINGNKIPSNTCILLAKYNIKDMIFITKIRGINDSGVNTFYPSMNLIPTN